MFAFARRRLGGLAFLASLLALVAPANADLGWRTYVDPSLSYSLAYPPTLFDGPVLHEHGGITLTSSSGVRLYIFAVPNPDGRSANPVAAQLSGGSDVYDVTYRSLTPGWLVLSGYLAPGSGQPPGTIFYERITFSPDRRFLAGFRLVYPQAQRPVFDPIIAAMGRSLKPPGTETTASLAPAPAPNAPSALTAEAHQAWCRQNYSTYDTATDAYVRYDGRRVRCLGPAD